MPDENITPDAGELGLSEEFAVLQDSLTPDTGALDLLGGSPRFKSLRTPGRASLALTGQPAIVEATNDMLVVLFDIWAQIYSPLYVEFDILAFPEVQTPLVVSFDIIVNSGTPLIVTFDIFLEAMLRARLYSDIQGPVAEVTLT